MPKSDDRFQHFDIARAFAAFAVVVHHICYECDNIVMEPKKFRKFSAAMECLPIPTPAIEGW